MHRTERYVGLITCKRSKRGCFFLGAKEPAACHTAMQVGLVANQALSSFKTYIYVCKNMYSRHPPGASICTTRTRYIHNHDITPPSTHWRGPTRRGFWPKIWLTYVNACRGISKGTSEQKCGKPSRDKHLRSCLFLLYVIQLKTAQCECAQHVFSLAAD